MSANGSNGFLNIEDANLRVRSGNVYAKGITVGGITVGASHGLQSVSDVSNTTSNTLQFTNATTSFKATSNIEVGGDVSYTSKPKISVESNVVTEYTGPHDRPLRKYPEVAMTSATTGGYTVTESGTPYPGGYQGWRAFDEVSTTEWISDQTARYSTSTPFNANSPSTDGLSGISGVSGTRAGSWIKLELPRKIRLEKTEIFRRDVSDQRFDQAYVYGSNDDTNWYQLSSITNPTYGQPANASGDMGPSIISHSTDTITPYKYFVIQITSLVDNVGTANIGQAYFYGYEEGSGSLDTTLKTVYNVPATTGTQLEVYYDGQDYTQASDFAGSGGVVDKAGGDQNGTVNGNVGFDSTYKAFTFNGNASNYINAGAVGLTDDAVHTVSLWFKYTSNGTHQAIFSISSNGADESLLNTTNFLLRDDGTMWFVHWGNDAKIPYIFIEEHWYHVTYTYVGGGTSLANRGVYINGKRVYNFSSDSTGNGGELTLTSPQMIIGKRYWAADQLPLNGSIANFRLYSKVLNADQVKELYDYQKDYFLGSKSQVTLYKGHLGVGVTEPSGQLELAGDERIQQYPPRALTGYETLVEGHGVFTVSASTVRNSSWEGWEAFDGDTSNSSRWISLDTYTGTEDAYNGTARLYSSAPLGEYVILKLPYSIKLSSARVYGLSGSPDSDNNRQGPEKGQIWGSNDGVTWEHVTNYDFGDYQQDQWNEINDINSPKYYSQYGFIVTKKLNNTYTASGPTQGDYVAVTEIQYFGTPGPTTLDKGSLSLTRSLDVPRVSRYDVDTETPRPEKLLVDYDTTVNSSPTDISGKGNHGAFGGSAYYSSADKAFILANNPAAVSSASTHYIEAELNNSETGNQYHSVSLWFKVLSGQNSSWRSIFESSENPRSGNGSISLYVKGATDILVFAHGAGNLESDPISNLYFQWHHIVLTYDGANRKMYLDGVLIKTVATTTWSGVANMTLRLGKNNATSGNEGCDCHISNFKLYWQTALEASEVRKLYNLGRTGRSMVISDTAVGIGKVPEANLDVRGNISCDGVVKPYTCAFSAYVSSGGNSSATDKFPADGVHFNIGNCYDASTYEFTAPVYGIYHMSWSAYTNEAATTTSRIFAHQSGNLIEQKGHTIEKHGNSLSLTVRMQAGETFYFRGTTTYPIYYYGADGHNRFSGHLICAL